MEHEGTVVYFKSSPARDVEGLQDEELTFDGGKQCLKEEEEMEGEDVVVKNPGALLSGWPLEDEETGTDQEAANFTRQVLVMIKDSALLTEEDRHLLSLTLSPHECLDSRPQTHPSKNHNSGGAILLSPSSCTTIAVALLLAGLLARLSVEGGWSDLTYYESPLLLTALVLTATTVTIVTVLLLTRLVLKRLRQWKLQKIVDQFSSYLSSAEVLLSLLTKVLQTIQEAEVVHHGYQRPVSQVPISRLERHIGFSELQCLVLRKRLFTACQRGVLVLRRAIQCLCRACFLPEELEENGFRELASVPLLDLHPHITTKLDSKELVENRYECLLLDSLKDACRLFAVLNSHLICRAGLSLLTVTQPLQNGSNSGRDRLDLQKLSAHFQEPLEFMESILVELNTSMEFYKRHLLGGDGVPPRSSKSSSIAEENPLTPLMCEVHCSGVKTRDILQRLLECESTLEETQVKPTSEVPSVEELAKLSVQLRVIQSGVEQLTEHVAMSLKLLDKLGEGHNNTDESGGVEHKAETADETPLPTIQDPSHRNSSSSSDEEEKVFEAYIPPNYQVTKEDLQEVDSFLISAEKKSKDVPMKMMKELRSVLEVMSARREERMLERKKRKEREGGRRKRRRGRRGEEGSRSEMEEMKDHARCKEETEMDSSVFSREETSESTEIFHNASTSQVDHGDATPGLSSGPMSLKSCHSQRRPSSGSSSNNGGMKQGSTFSYSHSPPANKIHIAPQAKTQDHQSPAVEWTHTKFKGCIDEGPEENAIQSYSNTEVAVSEVGHCATAFPQTAERQEQEGMLEWTSTTSSAKSDVSASGCTLVDQEEASCVTPGMDAISASPANLQRQGHKHTHVHATQSVYFGILANQTAAVFSQQSQTTQEKEEIFGDS